MRRYAKIGRKPTKHSTKRTASRKRKRKSTVADEPTVITRKHSKSERERKRRRAAAVRRYDASPRGRFNQHKFKAGKRGIAFEMSFDEWLHVWMTSGHFNERGNKTGQGYVMARKRDLGAYAIGNVDIVPHRINIAERNRNFFQAKRAGLDWDWLRDGPPQLPDTDVPF